jgi:hypothetical protein
MSFPVPGGADHQRPAFTVALLQATTELSTFASLISMYCICARRAMMNASSSSLSSSVPFDVFQDRRRHGATEHLSLLIVNTTGEIKGPDGHPGILLLYMFC